MIAQNDVLRAKSAPIIAVLADFGHRPAKKIGPEFYYHSPLHEEKTPSFCVKQVENSWYDHGLATGGDVVELMLRLSNTTFPDVVAFLLDYAGATVSSALVAATPTTGASSIINLKRGPLTDTNLLAYLARDRGLDMVLLSQNKKLGRWLGQAVYQRIGKATTFRSISWLNDLGGLVLKGPYLPGKGFTSTFEAVGYTLVPAQRPEAKQLAVYEGFFDYLSALVLTGQSAFEDVDALILNSTTNTKAALELIEHYQAIDLCLDNDGGGDRCTAAWIAAVGDRADVVDQRIQWAGYKDLNDFLCGRPIQPKTAAAKTPRPKPGVADPKKEGYGHWWLWVKWKVAVVDADGVIWETMKFNSDDNQYASRERLKELRKKLLAEDKVAVCRLCTHDDKGKMKILEQWPKPKYSA